MVGHRGSLARSGFTMPAQVRNDQPISRFQRRHDRIPEMSIGRKGMQEHERKPAAADLIDDLRTSALDGLRPHKASIAATELGIRDLLCASRCLNFFWLAWHYDPRDRVSEETCATENRHQHPDKADQ